jgi:hypothetical protein
MLHGDPALPPLSDVTAECRKAGEIAAIAKKRRPVSALR